jgi:hypothetical protein
VQDSFTISSFFLKSFIIGYLYISSIKIPSEIIYFHSDNKYASWCFFPIISCMILPHKENKPG